MEAITSAIGRHTTSNNVSWSLHFSSLATNQQTHTHNTMSYAKNSLVAEGDVSVQKVDKIEPIYYNNLITRPWVFANPRVMTVLAQPPPGAGVSVSGQKKVFQRALSEQEIISDYIATKKRQFAGEIPQGGTWFA